MKKSLIIILAAALLMISSMCFGATYYVDATNGNDNNSGLSPEYAWKTIGKINSSSFLPNDNVLFKRDEVWREQLTVPSSGTAGNPIKFAAYGVGQAPILSGAQIEKGWSLLHGTIYFKNNFMNKPNQIFYNDIRLNENNCAIVGLAINDWNWDSNTLYVNVGENPDNGTLETSAQDRCIQGWHKNFIYLENLSLMKANKNNILNQGGKNWVIDQIASLYSYGEGIRNWGDNPNFTIDNVVIKNSLVKYSGSTGIYAGNYGINGIVQNNIVQDNCQVEGFDTDGGIKIWGENLKNFFIIGNHSSGNGSNIGTRGAGIWIDNSGGGHNITQNNVHGNQFVGIYLEKEHVFSDTVAYNIVHNESASTQRYAGTGILVADNVRNNKILNNTIFNCRYGIAVYGTWPLTSNSCSNNLIANNLVLDSSTRALAAWGGGDNDGTYGYGNVYRNNCFGPENNKLIEWGTSNYYSSYSTWESKYGSPTYSIIANPLFINIANLEFSLQPNSPCIDKGVNIGFSKDFYGQIVPNGLFPDIGAVEFYQISAPNNLRILNIP